MSGGELREHAGTLGLAPGDKRHHDIVVDATQTARDDADGASKQMVFRNFPNSKLLVLEPNG